LCSSEDEALQEMLSAIHVGEDRFETAAILTMTEEQAKCVYEYMKRQREDVYYIDRDSSAFKKGVTVTTYYLAKGLEFDQVFIFGGEKENPFFSQYRYISATRALHELYVYDITPSSC
jgi:DNA helicase-2/ATP-dependent DNA helicase PcrA